MHAARSRQGSLRTLIQGWSPARKARQPVDNCLKISAFDIPSKPRSMAMRRARAIATSEGLRDVYTGNVDDTLDGTSYRTGCERPAIEGEGTAWRLAPLMRRAAAGTVAWRWPGTA